MSVRAGPRAAPRGATASARGDRAAPPRVCLPPYVSLDQPWCADFGVAMPIGPLPAQRYASAEAVERALGRAADGVVVGGFQF